MGKQIKTGFTREQTIAEAVGVSGLCDMQIVMREVGWPPVGSVFFDDAGIPTIAQMVGAVGLGKIAQLVMREVQMEGRPRFNFFPAADAQQPMIAGQIDAARAAERN